MKKKFWSFKKARAHVHKLNLQSRDEWKDYNESDKFSKELPKRPDASYKNKGWKGWGDWLGTGNISPSNRIFLPFKEARSYVRSKKFKNQDEWRKFAHSDKLPKNIPTTPERTYENEWKGYGDWLGNARIANQNKKFRSYNQAKEFAILNGIQTRQEWDKFRKSGKKPNNIPTSPDSTYKNKGWINWGDFLGTGRIAPQNIEYLPWKEAKPIYQKLAEENNIKKHEDWKNYCKTHKLPKGIPATPWQVYTEAKIFRRMK